MCEPATLGTIFGGLLGLANKPKAPQMQAPAPASAPPQESKAPDRAAISADQKAAATLFGSGPERQSINIADMTLGKSALKGNEKLGA